MKSTAKKMKVKATPIEVLVYSMLTENTGSHMLDSGGAYGRAWQRNQDKSIEAFRERPMAILELSKWGKSIEANVTIDVFHYLTNALELDTLCDQFNQQPVENWESEEFYGVSASGEKFLLEHFDLKNESFNTYNWNSNHSQVLQGREIVHKETGDLYLILQIHGGCDVRGGYTDAKLFKIYTEYFLSEDCYFEGVDWMGEFINHEGRSATEDDFKALAKKYKLRKGKRVEIPGSISINGSVL